MSDTSTVRVLVINPGGTSTKIAVFENDDEIFSEDERHDPGKLAEFPGVYDQYAWRLETVRKMLEEKGFEADSFQAVVGRGGPVASVPSGTYAVDEPMLAAIRQGRVMVEHPSMLGAPMADEMASSAGCPAYIVDPVSVDEFVEVSRLTGLPEIQRKALSHALSVKSAGREGADNLGVKLDHINMIVLHLGSGITVAAQKKGRQIDASDASASGPMAPTRSGSLPALDLARLCYSGKYTQGEMKKLLVGGSGWKAHLGTDDVREIYKRIDDGDTGARTVIDATLLQIAKETAAMAVSLDGQVDAIVITGGIARSGRFIEEFLPKISWLCPKIEVLPGENEMPALARGAIRALSGRCKALSMGPYIEKQSKERS